MNSLVWRAMGGTANATTSQTSAMTTTYIASTPTQRGTPSRCSRVTPGSSTKASARPMKKAGSAPRADQRSHRSSTVINSAKIASRCRLSAVSRSARVPLPSVVRPILARWLGGTLAATIFPTMTNADAKHPASAGRSSFGVASLRCGCARRSCWPSSSAHSDEAGLPLRPVERGASASATEVRRQPAGRDRAARRGARGLLRRAGADGAHPGRGCAPARGNRAGRCPRGLARLPVRGLAAAGGRVRGRGAWRTRS